MTSLYIHIPFCERKCFYCSFVVSVGHPQRRDAYLEAIAREARRYKGLKVGSVYVGGGTPSYLTGDQLKRLFGMIRENFAVDSSAEYTVEANPESLDEVKLQIMRASGVNRISLGVQSLNDRYLQYLGRNHSQAKARLAYRIIREAGFTNINLDLMFAFPQQTLDEIRQDVAALTALASEHISLYMLNLEEHSRFYAQKIQLPDDDLQAQQYAMVVRQLEEAGYRQYEISNFARPGRESRHNLHYWQGGEYIGLGVGAHSYWQGKLFWNVSRLNTYIDRSRQEGSAVEGEQLLDAGERLKQALLIGLRMNDGIRLGALEQLFGCHLGEEESQRIEHFVRHGFLAHDDGRLKATEQGRLVLDELCAQLS